MNPETAQAIASFLLEGFQTEHQITKKVLAALPDAKLSWRPHEKGKSAGELAWHIVSSEIWFLEGIAAGQFGSEEGPKAPERISEILAYYEKNFPAALAKVQALTPEALAKPVNFYGAFNYPAFVYLSLVASHSIHHRGQLSTYLRAVGEKVPSIYGGSADEPWTPPTEAAS